MLIIEPPGSGMSSGMKGRCGVDGCPAGVPRPADEHREKGYCAGWSCTSFESSRTEPMTSCDGVNGPACSPMASMPVSLLAFSLMVMEPRAVSEVEKNVLSTWSIKLRGDCSGGLSPKKMAARISGGTVFAPELIYSSFKSDFPAAWKLTGKILSGTSAAPRLADEAFPRPRQGNLPGAGSGVMSPEREVILRMPWSD